MGYTIKKLSPEDVSLAKQLFIYFQIDDGIENPIIPSDNYLGNLLSKGSFHVFVALEDNLVIGGITGYELEMYKESENEMFLYEIAVHENHRQNGIGSKLIGELKKLCVEKNISVMFVGTSTDNKAAIQLYKATGGEMELIPWFVYDLKK